MSSDRAVGKLAGVLGVFSLALLIFPAPLVLADSPGAAAAATQHALEEQANACAQRKPECFTPTPTPTVPSTSTAVAIATTTTVPTSTIERTPTATPTPEPCWLTDQDLGDPDSGYIVFDETGAPVPCPPDQPLPTEEPTPTAEPSAVSTETPVPVRPAPAVAIVASQPVAAAPPPAPALPTYTPYPTYTPPPTPSLQITRAAVSTPTLAATGTPTPTATGTPQATPTVTATPRPVVIAGATIPPLESHWDWWSFFKVGSAVVLIVAALGWLMTRRRVAVWKPRTTRRPGNA